MLTNHGLVCPATPEVDSFSLPWTVYNAIAWSDSRTTSLVHRFESQTSKFGQGSDQLKPKTGLPLSNYFTAIKLRWLVDNVPAVRKAMASKNLLIGTVDTYLIWVSPLFTRGSFTQL